MAAPHNSTRGNIVEFKGLQNAQGLKGVPFGAFFEAENVDITRRSTPVRRPGRTQVYNGAVQDVWGDGVRCLFVTSSGELRELYTDETTGLLRSGTTSSGRLAAVRVADTLYWSYGTHQGVVEARRNRPFGIQPIQPAGVVELPASERLAPGRYGYAWAGVTATGDEGPVGLRGTFELTERGGVELVPPIPTQAHVTRLRAYVTEVDGRQLLQLGQVDAPSNVSEQAQRHVEVIPLLGTRIPVRELVEPLPAFTCGGEHNGRLVVGYGDLVLYSERFDYEYFAPDRNYVPMGSVVRIIAPVDGGVFVVTDSDHYFLAGSDVATATLQHKASYGGAGNTLDYLDSKEHSFDGVEGRVAVWAGHRGPVFGLPSGQIEDTGDGVLSVPSNLLHGAGAVRKTAGDVHYVSVVRYRGVS